MPRYVLGVSAHYHDAAAALLADGQVVAASSEERFSRVKHDASLPLRSVRFCLAQAGVRIEDVEAVVYYEKPIRKFERIVVTQMASFPRSRRSFTRAMRVWLADRLWLPATLPAALGCHPSRLYWSDHLLSHAASAFYTSPYAEAAVLVADGVGEWATTSLWRGGPGGLERIAEIRFPHSIGLLYSAFTAWLGFAVNDGEYKVMGMAAFGEPTHEDKVRRVLRSLPGGGFEIDLAYVAWHHSATDSISALFEGLFGPSRAPGAVFDPTTAEGKYAADVAASIQKVTEDTLVELANELHRRTGLDHLCYAGGVALNSVANQKLLARTPFRSLWVHPAAGDAGGAVGAALWAWHEVVGGARSPPLTRPDLGWEADDGATRTLLTDLGVSFEEVDPAVRAAEDIASGRIVGWCQGRSEWGPRALGFRSILADPARPGMREAVNTRIKFRELFRPFAPSVHVAPAEDWFELTPGADQPLRWMLLVAPVREPALDWATTHVDGSARVHLVEPEVNPLFHRLIGELGARTGRAAVLNTSFNLKGEPIVTTPLDALATFRRSGLDALYVGPFRVAKDEA
ncbi:MAG: carbamoyltransferase N-terminal domain-containing protein [Pseudomonadota bacterium]|nr:carbamoyltransferase N-terminal domain-containing protein [Pseudomonadota bacterium]